MAAPVILSEQKVIDLLRNFIKETELEPRWILANSEQQDLPQLPEVITSLRNEIVVGNWNKALQLISSLAVGSSDLSSMKYSICKQRYLESINTLFSSKVQLDEKFKTLGKDEIVKYVNPEQLKLVATHLKSLEGLCSQEDYFKLSFLISCPDLKTHPSYSNWSVESGRLETASSVCQQALKLKYSSLFDNHCLPSSRPKRSNRLLQLVAKGILYEKCESLLLQQHQTGSSKGFCCEHGEILDVHSWLAQLPNETFQTPMHKLSLCVVEQCCVKHVSSCDPLPPVHQRFAPSDGHNHLTATMASAVSLPDEVREAEKTLMTDENGIAAVNIQHTQEVVGDDIKAKEAAVIDDGDHVTMQKGCYQNAEEDTEGSTNYHLTQEIKTNGYSDLQQPQKTDTSDHLQQRDVFTPENCHTEVQPMVNSSTPKPSRSKHVVELPVTSPIDRDKETADYGPYHTPTSLRKEIITKNRSQVSNKGTNY